MVTELFRSMAAMAESLQRVGGQPSGLSVEERNLVSWRMGVSLVFVVQRGASSPALSRRRKIHDGIPALMDENLILWANTGESKEQFKMKYDQVVDIPVAALRPIHMNQSVQKTIKITQLRFTDKVSGVLVAGRTGSTSAGRGGCR